jgi:homoserine kinase type II
VALLTALPLAAARELGRRYGVELIELEPLVAGSVNSNFRARTSDGRLLFARLYEEQGLDGARTELSLLADLAAAGVPVVKPLSPAGALPLRDGKPFALFPWVAGESLCFRRTDADACRKVGRALAGVHLAGAHRAPLGLGRFGPADMRARLDAVERTTSRADILADVARVRGLYERFVPLRDPALPAGIVHGDLFRDNVLWHGGEIAALLDFESAFHGPLVYDLLVTLAAWCYGDAFELSLVRAMVEGYASVRPLSAAEVSAVPNEGALACLRFATSRITDFELRTPPGARPVRDFRRFLARLDTIAGGGLAPAFSGN